MWVSFSRNTRLARIDPRSGAVARFEFDQFGGFSGIGIGGGSVWAGGLDLLRVDPATGRTVSAVSVEGIPAYEIAVGVGAVWVPTDLGVSRVDLETEVVTAVPAGGPVRSVSVTDDAVWALNDDGRITQLDPVALVPVGGLELDSTTWDQIAVSDDSIWLVDPYGEGTVGRISLPD